MSDEYEATMIFGYLALSTIRKLDLEIPLCSFKWLRNEDNLFCIFPMFLYFSSYCFETITIIKRKKPYLMKFRFLGKWYS